MPAGVPTTARWKEPGDEVPKFTLAMFNNNRLGAVTAAKYYVTALNWALATLNPQSFLAICDSARCRSNAERNSGFALKGQHVKGGRASPPTQIGVRIAPEGTGAAWIVRLVLPMAEGQLLTINDTVVQKQNSAADTLDIYAKWSGRMWRITNIYLAS